MSHFWGSLHLPKSRYRPPRPRPRNRGRRTGRPDRDRSRVRSRGLGGQFCRRSLFIYPLGAAADKQKGHALFCRSVTFWRREQSANFKPWTGARYKVHSINAPHKRNGARNCRLCVKSADWQSGETSPDRSDNTETNRCRVTLLRRGYLFEDVSPLYVFGFGLSYSTFAIFGVERHKKKIRRGATARVSAEVTNTGTRAGS